MALPTNVQAEIDRFNAANNNAYNAVTNPFGHGQGGHRQNFVADLQGMVTLVGFTAAQATSAAQKAALTAEDASNTGLDRIATGQDVVTSAGKVTEAAGKVTLAKNEADRALAEANRAMGYANGLNMPPATIADAGKFSRVKADGSGYELASAEPPNGSITLARLAPEVQNTLTTFRKDLLLTALQAAAGAGDAVRLSSGFLDPYTDTSDVTVVDAFFNVSQKLLSIGAGSFPSGLLPYGQTNGTGSVQYSGDSNIAYVYILMGSQTADAYFNGAPGNYFYADRGYNGTANPNIPTPINTIEIVTGAAQVVRVGDSDPNSPAGGNNLQVINATDATMRFWALDFSAAPLKARYTNCYINSGNGHIRAFSMRAGRRAAYAGVKPSVKVLGASLTDTARINPSSGQDITQITYNRVSAIDMIEADFPSAVKLREVCFHNYGGYQQSGYQITRVEASNDKTNWTIVQSGAQSLQTGNGNAGLAAINISNPISARYYRLITNGMAGIQFGAMSFITDGAGAPVIASVAQAAAAAPATARVGVQLKLLDGAPIGDFVAEVTRNSGGSWSPAALGKVADQFDGFGFYEALVDISGQPTGTQMQYRFRGLNGSRFDVGGALLQWG